MKSLHMKLALAAVAAAALASPAPAFAAHIHQQPSQQPDYATNGTFQRGQFYTYPNGAVKTGSAENVESGAEFNLLQHPVE
jgi:opacity protein-like surface antigen